MVSRNEYLLEGLKNQTSALCTIYALMASRKILRLNEKVKAIVCTLDKIYQ